MTSQIVDTIIQQLGGRQFQAMTGGKFVATNDNTLTVVLPRYTTFTVMYDQGADLYKVGMGRMVSNSRSKDWGKMKILHSADGVYAEDLQELFTEWTGLYTRI